MKFLDITDNNILVTDKSIQNDIKISKNTSHLSLVLTEIFLPRIAQVCAGQLTMLSAQVPSQIAYSISTLSEAKDKQIDHTMKYLYWFDVKIKQ